RGRPFLDEQLEPHLEDARVGGDSGRPLPGGVEVLVVEGEGELVAAGRHAARFSKPTRAFLLPRRSRRPAGAGARRAGRRGRARAQRQEHKGSPGGQSQGFEPPPAALAGRAPPPLGRLPMALLAFSRSSLAASSLASSRARSASSLTLAS